MRTLLAGERTTIAAARVAHYLKVEVQNASGTWKDVGALLGNDYVLGATWGEHRDQAVAGATVRVRRRIGADTLSPLVVASLLNRDDAASYAPLLDIGRGVRISSATLSPFGTPVSGDWREMFTGRIDDVLWDQDPITVQCSDLGAWLMDTQIEAERPYGSSTGIAVETVIAQILADWPIGKSGLATPTLSTPVSPAWNVNTFKQSRVKLLEGLRALALQIGWDLRYRYDASHVARLTLYDPDRDSVAVHATIGPTEYTDLRRLGLALADIRNAGRSTYKDSSGVTHEVTASDASSISKYGRRYFELPAADGIDTLTEAQTRIDAAVWDLASPGTELDLVLPYFWPVQLHDRHTITQNGEHFDTDQTLAVVGYQHDLEDGYGRTTISYAGRVIGAYADWRRGIRVVAPSAPADETGLADFKYTQNADGSTTCSWRRGVLVDAVWVYQTLGVLTDPVTALYPSADTLPYPVLRAGSDSYTVPRPPFGSRYGVRFRPMTAGLAPGRHIDHVIGTNGAYSVGVVVTENPNGTATLTATATDPAGLIATGSRLTLWITQDGVRSLLAPTTTPSAGVTTGTYTWTITQDEKHGTLAELFTNLAAGATLLEWTGTIDADKLANVVNATANIVGTTATVRVLFDTDTRTGASGFGWRVDGGAETLGTVAGDRTASFTVAASTTVAKLVEVRGYNLEGVAGPWAPVPIDAAGPPLLIRARLTATTATSVTVRVAVADPFPQGTNSGTIAYDATGTGGVTPASGGTVTPAATLTEAAGTFIDYTITRPAFGTGTGRVTFTGSAANRQSATDAVEVPAQEQDNGGSIVLETNGSDVILNLSGPSTCNSWRYATSTSAMPSDATAQAGTVAAGRQVRVTFSGVIPTLGNRYYVKAIPYTDGSGGGTAGPSVSAEVERQNKSTGKTIRLPAQGATWVVKLSPADPTHGIIATQLYGQNGADIKVIAASTRVLFRQWIAIPKGTTVTAFRGYARRLDANSTVKLGFYRVEDAAFTPIGSVLSVTTTGAYQTIEQLSLSESTSGARTYVIEWDIEHNGSVTDFNSTGAKWAEVDHTAPALDINL